MNKIKKISWIEFLIAIFIIILCFIINTACNHASWCSFNHPKFTITQTTCWNETQSPYKVNSCLVYYLRINKTCNENITCMLDLCLKPEQKCETKEVDEIKYNQCLIMELKTNKCISYEFEPTGIILKKDLNEKWLNENCEIVCNYGVVVGGENTDCSNSDTEWKCGDYEVTRE